MKPRTRVASLNPYLRIIPHIDYGVRILRGNFWGTDELTLPLGTVTRGAWRSYGRDAEASFRVVRARKENQ